MRIWWKLVYKRLFVSNLNDVLLSSGWPVRVQTWSAINFMPIAKRIYRKTNDNKWNFNWIYVIFLCCVFVHGWLETNFFKDGWLKSLVYLYFLIIPTNRTIQSWSFDPKNFRKKVLILVKIFNIYFAILLQHCMDDIWEMCFLSAPGCCGGWSQNVIVYTERERSRGGAVWVNRLPTSRQPATNIQHK